MIQDVQTITLDRQAKELSEIELKPKFVGVGGPGGGCPNPEKRLRKFENPFYDEPMPPLVTEAIWSGATFAKAFFDCLDCLVQYFLMC